MPAKLRLGVIGLVHDHIWGLLNQVKELDDAEVVAVADPNEPLREKACANHGLGKFYDDCREMIDSEKLDGVIVGRENSAHADILETCAAKGVHYMGEKPMAANLAQADRMLTAAEKAGIVCFINFPTTWQPALQHAHTLVQEGAIGQVFQLRMRSGHHGPKEIGCSEYFWSWLYDAERNGAGAYMDFCCYGANISRWFLGHPQSVIATRGQFVKNYDVPDDNGILLLEYPKATGICEGSWTQIGPQPGGWIINGSTGTLVPDAGGVKLYTLENREGKVIECPPLPKGKHNGPAYFANCIRRGEQPEGRSNMHLCRDAQEILEAGLVSAREGRRIALPLK